MFEKHESHFKYLFLGLIGMSRLEKFGFYPQTVDFHKFQTINAIISIPVERSRRPVDNNILINSQVKVHIYGRYAVLSQNAGCE